jgi:hypothetical protein
MSVRFIQEDGVCGWTLSDAEHEEYQRYREREPLVQKLIARLDPDDPIENSDFIEPGWVREMEGDARAVRDFKLSPSAAEGDESA